MRIAIVHYHLKPGGVTRVIETASGVLTAAGIAHVILTGDCESHGASALLHRVVPGLGYLEEPGDLTAARLVAELRAAATDAHGALPDVWHFHNHSLGKNRLLPHVISLIAAENEAIVLQIHDLAEQGRPENYPCLAGIRGLYPFSPRIHYAFLNPRDLALFIMAGLPPAYGSLLPNPVSVIAAAQPALTGAGPPLLLAPVRGIRRKNLGELVLLAALAPEGTRVAISRAPENPAALPIHDQWRKFASKHRLAIGFDVVDHFMPATGAATDFDSWIHHATHFVTTAVSEGFGFTYLESVAHGKPLIGRNLAHLTADHARHGIRAGRLYDAILVPIEWVDISLLRDHLTIDMERDHRLYQRPFTGNPVRRALDAMIQDGLVDFGNLPEPLQQGIIERLADPSERAVPLVRSGDTLLPLIDWLADVLAQRSPTATPDQLAPYSPANYQKSIIALYERLIESPASPIRHVPADEILTHHLRPENFHFLLSSLRPESSAKRQFRAVIFDVYGTLLIAPPGGVKPDPLADPVLRDVLRQFGHTPPDSPSTALHEAVLRHHAASGNPFSEIDLRDLWREILSIGEDEDEVTPLVMAIEDAWHPAQPMPGAGGFIQRLARLGMSLGILSNAQCNTLPSLGPIADLFAPELILLSYQHGIAKPSPDLYQMLAGRLAGRGIQPHETLFIGNDPHQDIVPAASAGFHTALFTGHPDSLRPGDCAPDITFKSWSQLSSMF